MKKEGGSETKNSAEKAAISHSDSYTTVTPVLKTETWLYYSAGGSNYYSFTANAANITQERQQQLNEHQYWVLCDFLFYLSQQHSRMAQSSLIP